MKNPWRWQSLVSHDTIVFRSLVFASLAAVGACFVGCGTSFDLTSDWARPDVKVDGLTNDWPDMQARIAGPDVRIGVRNDKEHLYICVTSPSRTTQFQMLALGTTVWFDPEGKKSKSFGIRFPLPGAMQGRRVAPPTKAEEAERFIEGLVNAAQRQFEIIGPAPGEVKKITDRQSKDVDVHLGYADGTLTYELTIPLQRSANSPYGATVDPAKPLQIGFETGDFAELMRSQMGAQAPPSGGGGGGGRGGRGGGGAGGGGVRGSDAPEGLKHWLTVHLAAGAMN